jgi:hypothetical protein
VRPLRLRLPPDEIAAYFGATMSESLLAPSYNVAPTNDVYAVVETPDGDRRLEAFHWGLVPVWAKDIKTGLKMINARAETVATSNAFKRSLKQRRCIIPVDGFYEWQKRPNTKRKQPYFIHRLDGEPLAFAGLWRRGGTSRRAAPVAALVRHHHHDASDHAGRPDRCRDPAATAWGAAPPAQRRPGPLGELLVPAPGRCSRCDRCRPTSATSRQDAHLIDEVDPQAEERARQLPLERPRPPAGAELDADQLGRLLQLRRGGVAGVAKSADS